MDIDDSFYSQNKNINVKVTSEGCISGYFCSVTGTETEIKVLEKSLDYAFIKKENKRARI